MSRRRPRTVHVGNIDALPENEDWLKALARDVDTKGKEVPNRFDREAMLRGETFTPLRERDEGEGGDEGERR